MYEILGLLFHRVDVVVVDSAVQVFECALEAGAQIEGYEGWGVSTPQVRSISRATRSSGARWCAIVACASRSHAWMGMGLRLDLLRVIAFICLTGDAGESDGRAKSEKRNLNIYIYIGVYFRVLLIFATFASDFRLTFACYFRPFSPFFALNFALLSPG